MPNPATGWFHTLTESVAALGTAAREYRTAHQAARTAAWHVEPIRLLPTEGLVSVPERHLVSPHDDAVLKLSQLYTDLEHRTQALYENTALACAHGTATVLRAVLRGQHPTHIELDRRDGRYVLPTSPLPDLSEELDWKDARHLAHLRKVVMDRERAAATARDWSFYEDLADYECAEIQEASRCAAGLADAAMEYGETAESLLHGVLLTARSEDDR